MVRHHCTRGGCAGGPFVRPSPSLALAYLPLSGSERGRALTRDRRRLDATVPWSFPPVSHLRRYNQPSVLACRQSLLVGCGQHMPRRSPMVSMTTPVHQRPRSIAWFVELQLHRTATSTHVELAATSTHVELWCPVTARLQGVRGRTCPIYSLLVSTVLRLATRRPRTISLKPLVVVVAQAPHAPGRAESSS
jgi:hypothetical protein